MLPTVLNTNQVKSSAGVEVEFQQVDNQGRQVVYAKIGEAPNAEERILVSHQTTGSGAREVRRSMAASTFEEAGLDGSIVQWKAHLVLTAPQGNIANYNGAKEVLARLGSFVFLTGADNTFVFNGSGTGADSLINGTK